MSGSGWIVLKRKPGFVELNSSEVLADKRSRGGVAKHCAGTVRMRLEEANWSALLVGLVERDVRRVVELEADNRQLCSYARCNYVDGVMNARRGDIRRKVEEVKQRIEEVLDWRYVVCPHCGAKQWVRIMKPILNLEPLRAGDCKQCGEFISDEDWTDLTEKAYANVHGEPEAEEDPDEDEVQDEEFDLDLADELGI